MINRNRLRIIIASVLVLLWLGWMPTASAQQALGAGHVHGPGCGRIYCIWGPGLMLTSREHRLLSLVGARGTEVYRVVRETNRVVTIFCESQ